jgi:hypothetical protein
MAILYVYGITTCNEWSLVLQHGNKFDCKYGCYGGCGWRGENIIFVVFCNFLAFETRSPFTNFEDMKMLFSFLKVKIYPKKLEH